MIMILDDLVDGEFETAVRGASCLFIPIDDKVGIKIFKDGDIALKERDLAYELNEFLAEYGYAPDVYGKCEFTVNGLTYYGYFCEVVEVIEHEFRFRLDGCTRSGNQIERELTEEEWGQACNLQEEICNLVQEHNKEDHFPMWVIEDDLHEGNVGWKNGEMVIIDFQ